MPGARMSDVTLLLEAAERGERGAEERLLNLVYSQLHRMAMQRLAGEAPGPTLQPTALVHDVWLRLVGGDTPVSAELVRLRFFAGLRIEEAAEVLEISERTAKRYWRFARVWLYDELQRDVAT
jgi:ECF sigma factor